MVIAIDGATWDVLDPMIERGAMPNLKKMMDENFSSQLNSTIPPVTAPAWASFITGTNPAKHGIFDFARRQPGSYKSSMNNANSIKTKTLWQILTEQGKTVGTINLPMTYPPTEVNGFMIPGFLAPGVSSQKILTHPVDLIDEINREVGSYQIFLEASPKALIHAEGKSDFLAKCEKIVQKRGETARFLYQKYQPDFFMVHFLMTDVVQHWFWHCLDETHPAHDSAEAAEIIPALENFYHTVDENVGKLIKLLDSDTTLLVLSDHGFGPLHSNIYLNRWFYEKKYLKLNTGKKTAIQTIRRIIAAIDVFNLRNRLLPSGKRRVALEKSLQHDFLINWEKTRCTAVPASIYGNIFLNVKGRDESGVLEPGAPLEKFKQELIRELGKITAPDSGGAAFSKIYSREQIFPGKNEGIAPDLLARPADGFAIFSQLNERQIFRPTKPWEDITGTHRVEGIFLAKGEKIVSAKNRSAEAAIIDLAPTILYLLGLPIPDSMDGKVLTEAIDEKILQKAPPKITSDLSGKSKGEISGYSEEEEELIRKRLQGLGYLE